MAINKLDFTSEQAHQAMIDGLLSAIRDKVRARILELIQPAIDDAVESSVKALEFGVNSYKSADAYGGVIQVILKDRRSMESDKLE